MTLNDERGEGSARPSWLLPTAVLAVAAALLSFWVSGFGVIAAYRQTLRLAGPGTGEVFPEADVRSLTDDQRLVLLGDRSAADPVARQVAIWDRWPTNRVYFHNALSTALAHYATLGTNDALRYRALSAMVDKGRPLDPDNARLDWVLAAKLMDQACAFKSTVGQAAGGRGPTVKSEMIVNDRARLDEAMRLLSAGLERPVYRRYGREMLVEREGLLGPPETLSAVVRRLVVAAGIALPDVTVQRNLARGATAYASLLIAEGRTREAAAYLGAWKPLGLRLNEDAFTLIDALVVGAIFKEAEVKVPELLRTTQGAEAAARTRLEIASLSRPVLEWKARVDRLSRDPVESARRRAILDRSGILLSVLLQSVAVLPPEADVAPSRMLDYMLLDHGCFGGLAAVLTLGLVAAAALGVYAGRASGAAVPRPGDAWADAARIAGWCVVAPLAVYGLVTCVPWLGGRELGLPRAWPKAVMQASLLAAVVLVGLHRQIARRADCVYEDVSEWPGRLARTGRRVRFWTLAVCGAVSLFPAAWLYTTETWGAVLAVLPLAVLAAAGLGTAAFVAWNWRACAARRRDCLARATVVAVPALALAVLVLNLGARGLLAWQERRWVARDTLLQVDPEMGGFTMLEAKVARDLRDGVLQAAVLLEAKAGH